MYSNDAEGPGAIVTFHKHPVCSLFALFSASLKFRLFVGEPYHGFKSLSLIVLLFRLHSKEENSLRKKKKGLVKYLQQYSTTHSTKILLTLAYHASAKEKIHGDYKAGVS